MKIDAVAARADAFAPRTPPRVAVLTAAAALGVAVLALWALTLGDFALSWPAALAAARGEGAANAIFVVQSLRLPRIVAAIAIGAALAVAGALFQGVSRNPLVSPDVIGINAGASLAAVYWVVSRQPAALLPGAAFAGALVAAIAMYVLAWNGGVDPDRLILVGIGVGAAATAGVTLLTVRYPVEIVRPAEAWLMGSLSGSTWRDARTALAAALILVPAALLTARPLRVLQLGDDVSRTLGIPLERLRLALIVIGCGLTAATTAVAGPIGFVALMAPHMARMLAGPVSGAVLAFTATIGALFLLGADLVAQHALPVPLPVGAITAAVGAPYFLFLLYRAHARI